MKKHWYHYLWIYSLCFFIAGFFNILFAWLGLISFILPLIFATATSDFATATATADSFCACSADSSAFPVAMRCRHG